jgi:hypothetical protein
MRAADAPYVPELQPGLEPVAGLSVPGLDNGYLSQMSDLPGAPFTTESQAGLLIEPAWRSLLGTNATGPHPLAQSSMGQHPLLRSSTRAGRTHVDNILVSLSHPRPPSVRPAVQPGPGPAEQALVEPHAAAIAAPSLPQMGTVTAAGRFLQPAPVVAEPPGLQPEAEPEVRAPLEPQARFALVPLGPAAAAAPAASAADLRPAPPAGPGVTPPAPGGGGSHSAAPGGPADGPGPSAAPPVGPGLLPRSPGAAAAARALAALAPGPFAHAPAPVPAAPQAAPVTTGTGAQDGQGLSNAATSSAARALSNLAGAAARAAAARTATPASDGPARAAVANGDGHGLDRHGPPGHGPDRHGPDGIGPDGPDLDMAPGAHGEPSGAPGAHDSGAPQADPQLDDILPAKSKSFFRLRR